MGLVLQVLRSTIEISIDLHCCWISVGMLVRRCKRFDSSNKWNDKANGAKKFEKCDKRVSKETVEPQMKMICNKNIWKCYFNSGRRSRDLNAIFIQNTLNLITTKTPSKWHLIEFLYDGPGALYVDDANWKMKSER